MCALAGSEAVYANLALVLSHLAASRTTLEQVVMNYLLLIATGEHEERD